MSITKKLAVLREHHYGLDKLPETIRVPALGERRDETVKPVGAASIDDLAFALIGTERAGIGAQPRDRCGAHPPRRGPQRPARWERTSRSTP